MENVLRRLQLTQLEILKVVDQLCREKGIHYSLYAGTLLGAVRHQGFIPWDDDLDICMERGEYNRFLAAWEESPAAGFLLQNKENTPGFTQSFSKIRKEHTTFLQDWEESHLYHTGIFIDIFPIDRLPQEKLKQIVFRWNCLRYLLYTREFIPPKGSRLEKLVSQVLLLTSKGERRLRKRQKLLERITSDQNRSHPTVAIETANTVKMALPPELLEEYTDLPFEDGQFMCFAQWDRYLTRKYGDYMRLPPASEQTWKHHPVRIDFEQDYNEIAGG